MAIEEHDGFNFLDHEFKEYIVVEDQRLEEYKKYIQQEKIEGIYLTRLYYLRDEIDFIRDLVNVKKLNLAIPLKNYDALYHLEKLEVLRLEEPRGIIDLTRFNKLEQLSIYPVTKHVIGVEDCKQLTELQLWRYKPVLNNLDGISSLTKLRKLKITQGTLISLKGCENLSELRELELTYLSKLTDIDELIHLKQLKVLSFEACKNVDFTSISKIKNLEKLLMINCGELPSLQFIEDLPKLKFLVFSKTNVVDGDLSYCERLEYVGFDNKRHYTHKMSDFVDVDALYGGD